MPKRTFGATDKRGKEMKNGKKKNSLIAALAITGAFITALVAVTVYFKSMLKNVLLKEGFDFDGFDD